MGKIKKQRNIKCAKCGIDIRQEINEVTDCYEYAEVFKEYSGKYYCNICLEELKKLIDVAVNKVLKKYAKAK